MAIASRVTKLPPAIRHWIDRRLYETGFSEYAELVAEIAAKGHRISKSSLHRYGRKLRDRVQAEEARVLGKRK